MAVGLRKLEKKVLSLMQADSRMSFSVIGKKLRTSQQQVSYTVNSLVRKGVLQQTVTHIDYSKLGVMVFGVFFRVHYVSESSYNKLIEDLVRDKHTSWVATCGGRFDIVTAFFTRNPSMFYDLLRTIMEKHSKQLRNYSVLTWVVRRGFARKNIFGSPGQANESVIGGDQPTVQLDKTDLTILSSLSGDSRVSAVKMAAGLRITPKTILERIKKLESLGVIKGYKSMVDIRKIGYSSRLLLIRYHNVTRELEDKFMSHLRSHPNVLSVVKTLGEWDAEVELEAPDFWELRKAEMKLRQDFAELIQDAEGTPLYHTHKRTFFPEFLLD